MQQEFEIWKDIPGYNGKYQASNLGRVKSIFRESKYGKRSLTGTILKFQISYRGYYYVGLIFRSNGVILKKKKVVHRLICSSFHENPQNKPQVNHKDLNQLNNNMDNLEWATAKENTNHAQINGRMPIKKPYIKMGNEWRYKPIIDLNTGIYYNSDEVAVVLNIKRRYVTRILNGERANDTSFRYA